MSQYCWQKDLILFLSNEMSCFLLVEQKLMIEKKKTHNEHTNFKRHDDRRHLVASSLESVLLQTNNSCIIICLLSGKKRNNLNFFFVCLFQKHKKYVVFNLVYAFELRAVLASLGNDWVFKLIIHFSRTLECLSRHMSKAMCEQKAVSLSQSINIPHLTRVMRQK